jgi:hypothetical protein
MTGALDSFSFEEFDFSGAMRDIAQGLLVKPVLHNYLYDARFPEFDLHFAKQDMHREPDDWFHPSTHPLMHPRVLYQYLAHPKTFPVEIKQYMGTLAVTLGTISHEFIQVCLTDSGIRPAALQKCTTCKPKRKKVNGKMVTIECKEPGVLNEELGERGHMDGLLDFTGFPNVPDEKMSPVFEFKTTNDNFGRLSKIEDNDLSVFKTKWPDYYAQQQRYMRMSKRSYSIVLMMEMSFPFTMREFHIPYDFALNNEIDQKYRRVRQAVADQRPPWCCGMKGCLARPVCGVTG